jgi:NADP-dependent 3-hydroxy acid dehydrogenase YdfG
LCEDTAKGEKCIWFVVSRPTHVNIADLLVLPAAQAAAAQVNRVQ